MGCADADNRACDGVGRAHGDTPTRSPKHRKRSGRFRGKATKWRQLSDALAHGFDQLEVRLR